MQLYRQHRHLRRQQQQPITAAETQEAASVLLRFSTVISRVVAALLWQSATTKLKLS